MRTLPDEALVARTRAGDREAFGHLVERYQDQTLRYVRYMGFREADAFDITQDAFVRAFRHLGRCGDPRRFGGWLFKIVSNLCRTAGRKQQTQRLQDLESASLVASDHNPQEISETSSTKERVRKAMDVLPPDQREALVLFYLRGHTLNEIVELTGASPSAIKMRLKRGRERLKAELDPLFHEVYG